MTVGFTVSPNTVKNDLFSLGARGDMTLGYRLALSNSSAVPLPPTGSLLCLCHHPHGIILVH